MNKQYSEMIKLTLQKEYIEYELKVCKVGRTIRLTIHPERGLVVTIPKRASRESAEKFIREKAEWVLKTLEKSKKIQAAALPKHTKKEIAAYKEKARTLAAARLAYFNSSYHFPYKNISIRNQKTRWGSCTREKNLNFNYKIALLSPEQADYIIVHELCHVKEMNHSAKFWNLVSQTVPEHVRIRKSLRLISLRT